MNLDRRTGFALTPETVFPVVDGSAPIVYSSHCFEHLDDATVDRMLVEARRVLAPDGVLVLKLPDFEQVLERWRAGDEAYFDQWGMRDVIPTWKNLGVEPTIDAKAAFIFCGWWNDHYGDEYGERRPNYPGAYHGPALPMNCVLSTSPHSIAAECAVAVPPNAHLNHRNAWSRIEMWELLIKHCFLPSSVAGNTIPGFDHQRDISAYFIASPS